MQSNFAHLECHPGQTHEKYLLNITSVTLLKASTQLRLNELLPQTIEKSFSMNHVQRVMAFKHWINQILNFIPPHSLNFYWWTLPSCTQVHWLKGLGLGVAVQMFKCMGWCWTLVWLRWIWMWQKNKMSGNQKWSAWESGSLGRLLDAVQAPAALVTGTCVMLMLMLRLHSH